jgi:hypothetical protein
MKLINSEKIESRCSNFTLQQSSIQELNKQAVKGWHFFLHAQAAANATHTSSEMAAAAEEEAGEAEAEHDRLHDVHDAERDGVDHRRRGAALQAEGGEPREPLPPQRARKRRRQPRRRPDGGSAQLIIPAPGAGKVGLPRDEPPQPPARPRPRRRGRRLRNLPRRRHGDDRLLDGH